MRVLIIEDKEALTEEYLRVFGRMLAELPVEFTSVGSIEDALVPLSEEQWDVILVDSDLGPPAMFPKEAEEGDGLKLTNGYDLVAFRRSIEDAAENISRSVIIGMGPSHVAAQFLKDKGADYSLLKLEIPKMAQYIQKSAPKEAQ